LEKRYRTKQKDLILECLKKNKEKHMTAEAIYVAIKESGGSIGIATVYRKLSVFEKEGVIRKFDGGDSACYQYVTSDEDCKTHYHLKCVKCNELFHVEMEHLDKLSSELKSQFDFLLDSGKSVLYGKCKKCMD
jgi:Fur family ferric uptake transcriptional regulator